MLYLIITLDFNVKYVNQNADDFKTLVFSTENGWNTEKISECLRKVCLNISGNRFKVGAVAAS